MKLYRHVVKVFPEGTVSQIFFICPSFGFRKFRKKSFTNIVKVSLFSDKIKTRA